MFLVNSLDSLTKDVLETFQNTFKGLGYKVTWLSEAERSILKKKEWQGHRWCFSGSKMGVNSTVESACFQRDDLLLLQENQRVSCNYYVFLYIRWIETVNSTFQDADLVGPNNHSTGILADAQIMV